MHLVYDTWMVTGLARSRPWALTLLLFGGVQYLVVDLHTMNATYLAINGPFVGYAAVRLLGWLGPRPWRDPSDG